MSFGRSVAHFFGSRENTVDKRIVGIFLAVVLPALADVTPDGEGDPPRPATPDFAGVRALASVLASRPYRDHRQPVSQRLSELRYDELRQIVFDERKSVWRRERLPFQLQFFHPGGPSHDQIDMNLVDGEEVVGFAFSRDMFDYGSNADFSWPDFRDAKFAGFRVLFPLNRPDKLDEVIVFHGASYYRALPADLVYGLSARALAIDCGGVGAEEFPLFREFWVDRPDREGRVLRLRGLFDSASLAGVAEFTIEPGSDTVTHVRLALYPRVEIAHCGIAPLTSMYWFGPSAQRRFDEYRPEVHDSDGLQMHSGAGEWLWRPLDNTGRLRNSAFADSAPKGFGLMQRERDPVRYQDLHAEYHRRPSAWVCPEGDWGPGAVRLVEISTETEFSDNIVAFWEPGQPLKAGEPAEFAYRVVWCGVNPERPALGRVVSTRSGAVHGQTRARRFAIDFSCHGPESPDEPPTPQSVVTAANGRVILQKTEYNPFQRTWRVLIDVAADEGIEAVELRARLDREGVACTETWTYCWTP